MTWKDHAACRDSEVDFFPVLENFSGGRGYQHEQAVVEYEATVAEAMALCAVCPVSAECAEFATNERDGIWAGVLHEPKHQRDSRRKAAADRERRLRERESA